jgi:tetratricopeptide (TPR) repeat protein
MLGPEKPSDGTSVPSAQENLTARIARLRVEHDEAESAVARAILLHEIGDLEEQNQDSAAAARDQLDAVNAEPEFREPLERLIHIIAKSSATKNLGKLLERLAAVADGAEERVRALLEQATHVADAEANLEAARAVLEEAAEEKPDDAAVFLALELIAGKLDDDPLRARALAARAEHCQHPTWRALLLLDLAKLESEQGDDELALGHIDQAIEQKSEATFLALLALEAYGRRVERDDLVGRALEAQAALLVRAMTDADSGDSLGVPRYARSAAYAADAWLRAAEAHRRRGDVSAAANLLDQALSRVSDEPALWHARLVAAELLGDTAKSAEIARAEIERGAKGGLCASLWLRVAESAASTGDAQGALDAVRRALAEDPASIPARVLELDLLGPGQDAAALAASLEATAECATGDAAKARYYLLAADSWARLAQDDSGAKAALSQAGMYGAPPLTVARVARMLASLTGDRAWFEESTRRLVASGASETEQTALWFELVRSRLLRKDYEHLAPVLAALKESDRGAWLGNALSAWILPLAPGAPSADSAAALEALARLPRADESSRPLLIAGAERALRENRREDAVKALDELHGEDPSDILAGSALATLQRVAGNRVRAAEVLAACAGAVADAELAAGLELEAGVLFWQGGERAKAVETFSNAAARSPSAGGPVLGWALRAADPDSIAARRRALEAAGEGGEDATLALERFGVEVGSDGDENDAREALDLVAASDDLDLRNASLLARALWSDEGQQRDAIEGIATFGGDAEKLARAALHMGAVRAAGRATPFDAGLTKRSAERWSEVDPSLPSAMEWLGAAVATRDWQAETHARRTIAEHLDGVAASAVRASASLIGMLRGVTDEPLLGEDTAIARLANLELAPPGSDPRRRAAALLGVQTAFGEESAAIGRALLGWNQLAAGEAEAAVECFRAVVEEHPEEVIGWDGLAAAAELTGDRGTVAEASAALGDAVSDDARGAELWERSAFILIDELGDVARGEFALSRAVERDIGRFKSFDKLFRLVRSRKDGERLLELIAKRLDVAEDPEEIAKLYWERARVMREAGDRDGALMALENVTLLEPDHVGALALSGEIYLTTGKLPEAAEKLSRLAMLSAAPVKQRLMSGVAAVDIYENKLHQTDKALDVLDGLYHSGLSTMPVRERLARAAAKAQAWEKATDVLEHLMHERDSAASRIEAARLAMAIHRDRLHQPAAAAAAAEKLLSELPDDGEALDLVLSGALPKDLATRLLDRGRAALVASLMRDPIDSERVDRLARIAAKLDNAPLRQATLGALVALGEGTPDIDRELLVLDQRVPRLPAIAIDPRALPDLCEKEDAGPIPELMSALATTFAEALGPGLSAFGVGKKEKVDPRAGLAVRNEIAAWAGALGLGDFDLYVGGSDDSGVFGVAGEVPSLAVGRAVQAPLSPAHRQAVARELFALKRGTSILRHRDDNDIAALVVASCRVGGYDVAAPQYAMLGEFIRVLGKEIPRKVKKTLAELALAVAQSGQDPASWARAATASLDRLAAIAAGDVSWVLSGAGVTRGQLGASAEAQERTARLLGFVLSPSYLKLRDQLGMGLK